jgi:molybdopterin converting factor small subunit
MRVEVRLFATLGRYLPEGSQGDSVVLELPDGATVGHVVRALGIPPELECLTVINGHDAPASQPLSDGDVLAMFPPLAGG